MAVRLIRANNAADVTAYEDVVFLNSIKGKEGVFPNVYAEFGYQAINYTKIQINSGMGILYGRQFTIKPGEEEILNFPAWTSSLTFFSIFIEIDTRNSDRQIASLKMLYQAFTYPNIQQGMNDLIKTESGIARIELYRGTGTTDRLNITKHFFTFENNVIALSEKSRSAFSINGNEINEKLEFTNLNNMVLTAIIPVYMNSGTLTATSEERLLAQVPVPKNVLVLKATISAFATFNGNRTSWIGFIEIPYKEILEGRFNSLSIESLDSKDHYVDLTLKYEHSTQTIKFSVCKVTNRTVDLAETYAYLTVIKA